MLLRFITRMKFHQKECYLKSDGPVHQPSTLCFCKSSCIRCFHYYSEWVGGGWVVRKIKNKDQLSPAEAEIGAELGNISIYPVNFHFFSASGLCQGPLP